MVAGASARALTTNTNRVKQKKLIRLRSEVIDVDEEESGDELSRRCSFQRRVEMLHQHRPIRQLRQAVAVRDPLDLQLGVLPLDRISDAACEHVSCRVAFRQIVLGAGLDGAECERFVFGADSG